MGRPLRVAVEVAVVALAGYVWSDAAQRRKRIRLDAADLVERQLSAALPLRLAFSEASVDYASVERTWIDWRDETVRALPRPWRLQFTSTDLTTRHVALAGHPIGSGRAAAAARLDWDIYRLRQIQDRLPCELDAARALNRRAQAAPPSGPIGGTRDVRVGLGGASGSSRGGDAAHSVGSLSAPLVAGAASRQRAESSTSPKSLRRPSLPVRLRRLRRAPPTSLEGSPRPHRTREADLPPTEGAAPPPEAR
jgi:hypothetical protein